jgi:4-carboxymuconolactone decarboxylase
MCEETMDDSRMVRGRKNLAAIEGSDSASIVEALKDVAPDLASLAIGFVYGELYSRDGLSLQQRQLATVAALAAMGGVEPQLKFHIAGALNVGCSPTEIVELMIHLVVYAGFPVAVNGTAAAKEVFDRLGVRPSIRTADASPSASRYRDGWARLREIDGHLGEQVIDSLNGVSPDLGRFIIEFSFGDVYTRSGMDLLSRELVTVAALTAMGSATPQLKVHMNGFLNVGGSSAQLVEIVTHIAAYAGFPRAVNGAIAAKEVLADRVLEPAR